MLRIFPLYYLAVAGVFIGAPLLARHFSRGDLISEWVKPGSQIFSWTFTLNFEFAYHLNEISRLIHPLWSLAIEEQFYLVWPVTVYLLSPRRLRFVCLALIGGALLIRVALVLAGQNTAAYALTPSRADSLALGAMLALAVRTADGPEMIRRWGWKTSAAALAGVIVTAFFSRSTEGGDPVMVTIGVSLVGVFYASALGAVVAAPEDSNPRRILRLRVLRFLGRYSYAIYMFHQAIMLVMLRRLTPASLAARFHSTLAGSVAFSACFGLVTIAAAMASWWLLEKRFLALKRAFRYQT